MPEVLVGLLRAFWPWVQSNFMFGAAGTYAVWSGTQSANGSPGGVIDSIIHAIINAPSNILSAFGGLFPGIHKATRSAVSHWALANEKAQAAWYTHLNVLMRETYSSNLATANAAADAIAKLSARERADTHYKHGITVKERATTALERANAVATRERALHRTVTREHVAQVRWNVRTHHSVAVTIPRELGRIRTRDTVQDKAIEDLRGFARGVEHGAINTFRWIRTHPYSAAAGVFTGAVALALSKLGFGFLRCRSWRNLGRQVTCNDASLALEFLGVFAAVIAITDYKTLVRDAQKVAEGTVDGIETILSVLG